MQPRARFVICLVGAMPILWGCSDLTPLTAGVCGNGVVDPGEDCDTFATAGEACGAADAGALACRFECVGTAACPAGYNCGVDEICRVPTGAFAPLGSPLAVGALGVTLADFNDDGYADALTHGGVNGIGAVRVQVNYLNGEAASLATFALSDKLTNPSVADVNGDGIPDVVAALRTGNTSGVTVLLGQPSNALALQSFPSATIPPAALPSPAATARVLTFSGLPEGPVTAYFMGTTGGAYPAGIYLPTSSGLPDISAPPAANSPEFFGLPEGPDQVVGDVVLAEFATTDLPPSQPCPSLVYETIGGVVRVLSPCSVTNGVISLALPPTLTSITLPAGVSGCTNAARGQCGPGVQVGDVDGDSFPDLIVSATATNAAAPSIVYGTYVAYGDGTGNFFSGPSNTKTRTQGTTEGAYKIKLRAQNGVDVGPLVQLGETYAAGDVNADGVADLVSNVTQYATLGGGPLAPNVTLLVTTPQAGATGMTRTVYQTPIGEYSWQTAAIADFDGDGLPDLVGGTPTNAGIEFFSGTDLAGGMYVGHEFLISTTGGPSHFAVGDFDGDGLADLAFAELDAANDGTVDVSLSYGNSSGPPGTPIIIGHYGAVAQITSAPPYPLIAIVESPLGASSTLTITRFTTGVGGRPPLSSQSLTSAEDDGGVPPQVAVAAVAGNFAAPTSLDGGMLADAGGLLGVAAVGRKGGDALWFLSAIAPPAAARGTGVVLGGPAVATTSLPANLDPYLQAGATTNQALLVAAAPLGQSGYASLVAVGSTGATPAESAVLVARVSGAPATFSPTNLGSDGAQVLALPLPSGGTTHPAIAEDGQLALADLDGDGYPDLVLLTGTSSTSSCLAIDPLSLPGNPSAPATSTARNLAVFWNDHNGGFSSSDPVTVATCEAAASCSEGAITCPQAFTTLVTNASPNPTLAYVTHAGVFLAQFSEAPGEARHLLPITPLPSQVSTADAGAFDATAHDAGSLLPTNVTGYTGIGAGDINGDGVDDLAVTAGGSLYFFAGIPVRK